MQTSSIHRKVKYTKMVIKDSLFTLLAQKPLQHIKVKELCNLADINRGTFYAHYADLYDLVGQLEMELTEKSQQMLPPTGGGTSRQQFVQMFRHIHDNIDDYRLIFLNPESVRCLNPMMALAHQQHIDMLVNQHGLPVSIGDYTFTFISTGCNSVFRQWIDRGMQESAEEMATLLGTLIQNGIAAVVAMQKA